MTIDPDAIKRFLDWKPPRVPDFKHMDKYELLHSIRQSTGHDYQFKTEPRPYQLAGLAFAIWQRRALVFLDMRLGKTKLALDWAAHFRQAGTWRGQGLIIAHSPTGLDVWENEIAKHSNLTASFVHSQNPEVFLRAAQEPTDLLIIPWSSLQGIFTRKVHNKRAARNELAVDTELVEMAADLFDLAVVDEIHLVKNKDTIRYQIGLAITRRCRFRLGLTGTPFDRDPYRVWTQAYLIDGGKALSANYWFFEQAFGKQRTNIFKRGGKQWVFDKAKLPLLKQRLDSLAISYARKEVTTEKVLAGVVRLKMVPEQREAYAAAINKAIELRSGQVAKIEQQFIRMRQIASGFVTFQDDWGRDRTYEFPKHAKLQWLLDLAEELAANGTQAVIFHEYTFSGQVICRALRKLKVKHGWFYGGTKNPSQVLRDYQLGRTQVLVANAAKGGVGIDLQNADYLCFYETPNSPTARAQAEARPMAVARAGRPLVLDDLVAAPVEDRMLSYYREGQDFLQAVRRDVTLLRA